MASKFLRSPTSDYEVTIISDGTTTQASISMQRYDFLRGPGSVTMGVGVAKRHKGDPRNSQLGVELALVRMFEDAISNLKQAMRDNGLGDYID